MATLKPFKTLGLPLPNLFSEASRCGRGRQRAGGCLSTKKAVHHVLDDLFALR